MSEPAPYGWTVSWADFSGFVEGTRRFTKPGQKLAPPPEATRETFRSKAEAEARVALLRATHGSGLVACITACHGPRAKGTKKPRLLDGLPRMTKRLTP